MISDYFKSKVVDRTGWPSGPWDNEPDFYEWTTSCGYQAYLFRLDMGAWAGNIIAPNPEGQMLLAFSYTLRDKRRDQLEYQTSMISKTDIDGIGHHGFCFESYEHPGSKRSWHRGPYKTLEESKNICEVIAQDIFEQNQTKSYENYFRR